MAGAASGWHKLRSGPLKGHKIFMPQATAQALAATKLDVATALGADDPVALAAVLGAQPSGVALGANAVQWQAAVSGHGYPVPVALVVGATADHRHLHDADTSLLWAKQPPATGVLHDVPLASVAPDTWRTHQDVELAEPPLPPLPTYVALDATTGKPEIDANTGQPRVRVKRQSSGAIVVEPDGRIWIYEPQNHYGGYYHTFAKGRVEEGLGLQQNACKEVREELGLRIELTGFVGDVEGDRTMTRYYIARRIGGSPSDAGDEAANVKLVTPTDALKLLNRTRDRKLLEQVQASAQAADDAQPELLASLGIAPFNDAAAATSGAVVDEQVAAGSSGDGMPADNGGQPELFGALGIVPTDTASGTGRPAALDDQPELLGMLGVEPGDDERASARTTQQDDEQPDLWGALGLSPAVPEPAPPPADPAAFVRVPTPVLDLAGPGSGADGAGDASALAATSSLTFSTTPPVLPLPPPPPARSAAPVRSPSQDGANDLPDDAAAATATAVIAPGSAAVAAPAPAPVGVTHGQFVSAQTYTVPDPANPGATRTVQGDVRDGLMIRQTPHSENYHVLHLGSGKTLPGSLRYDETVARARALQQVGIAWTAADAYPTPNTGAAVVTRRIYDAAVYGYLKPGFPAWEPEPWMLDVDHAAPLDSRAVPPLQAPRRTFGKTVRDVNVPLYRDGQPLTVNGSHVWINGDVRDGLCIAEIGDKHAWQVWHMGSGTPLGPPVAKKSQARTFVAELHTTGASWTADASPLHGHDTPKALVASMQSWADALPPAPIGRTNGKTVQDTLVPVYVAPGVYRMRSGHLRDGLLARQADDGTWQVWHAGSGRQLHAGSTNAANAQTIVDALHTTGVNWTTHDAWHTATLEHHHAIAAALGKTPPPPPSFGATGGQTVKNTTVAVPVGAGAHAHLSGDLTDGLLVQKTGAGTWAVCHVGSGTVVCNGVATQHEAQGVVQALQQNQADWTQQHTPITLTSPQQQHHKQVTLLAKAGGFKKGAVVVPLVGDGHPLAQPADTPVGVTNGKTLPNQHVAVLGTTDAWSWRGDLTDGLLVQKQAGGYMVRHIGSGMQISNTVATKAEAQAMVDALHATGITWTKRNNVVVQLDAAQQQAVAAINIKAAQGGFAPAASPPAPAASPPAPVTPNTAPTPPTAPAPRVAPEQPRAATTPPAEHSASPTPADTDAVAHQPAAAAAPVGAVAQPPPPAAAPAPAPSNFPPSVAQLTTVSTLGGSTGAQLVKDPASGVQYVKKTGGGGEAGAHIREEATADGAYRALGMAVPPCEIYETANGPVKLAQWVPGTSLGHASAATEQLRDGFAADALLANWDVIGQDYDNVLVGKDGTMWRIDNGGALRYRAQGAPKGTAWNEWPMEVWSMRSKTNVQCHNVFGAVGVYRIAQQIDTISAKRDAVLAAVPQTVRATLDKRITHLQWIRDVALQLQAQGYAETNVDGYMKSLMTKASQGAALPSVAAAVEAFVP